MSGTNIVFRVPNVNFHNSANVTLAKIEVRSLAPPDSVKVFTVNADPQECEGVATAKVSLAQALKPGDALVHCTYDVLEDHLYNLCAVQAAVMPDLHRRHIRVLVHVRKASSPCSRDLVDSACRRTLALDEEVGVLRLFIPLPRP